MTFIDKKIEELEKKFSLDCSLVNNKARISISGLLDLKSWLRQTITEAEELKFKEGQKDKTNLQTSIQKDEQINTTEVEPHTLPRTHKHQRNTNL